MSGPFSATLQFTSWKVSNPDTGAGSFCRTYYRPSTWYRSGTRKKHARDPLPYTMQMGSTDLTLGRNQTCNASADAYYTTLTESRWNNANNLASNRAASSFVAKAQGLAQASMGETLGEWKSALDMLTSRVKQLAFAARYLRAGKFDIAARALSLTKDSYGSTTRRRLKTFGQQWLELHLGWVPLCQDIYNATQVFSKDPFPKRCLGTAHSSDNYSVISSFPTHKNTKVVYYKVGYHVRGDVHVVNPNVALAAQLGLVNPVSVAWQLVPYSFVIDWFVNLSDLLGLYDGLLGCETLRASYTTLRESHATIEDLTRSSSSLPWDLNSFIGGHGAYCKRILGLPPSHLTYINSPRFSWQRGATAVALLLGYLR